MRLSILCQTLAALQCSSQVSHRNAKRKHQLTLVHFARDNCSWGWTNPWMCKQQNDRSLMATSLCTAKKLPVNNWWHAFETTSLITAWCRRCHLSRTEERDACLCKRWNTSQPRSSWSFFLFCDTLYQSQWERKYQVVMNRGEYFYRHLQRYSPLLVAYAGQHGNDKHNEP